MSLDKIYELNDKAEKFKEEADAAYNRYNYVLGDLENERQKFKKIVGIVDPVEKESFSLWNLIKEMFDDKYPHACGFHIAILLIPLGFLFLMVNIVPFIIITGAGFIFLLVGFVLFWNWKRSRKCQSH